MGATGFFAHELQKRTSDVDEALELVSSVYCPHSLSLGAHQRQINTHLRVVPTSSSMIVHLNYGAEVDIDAGNHTMFLMMRCAAGWGTVEQAGCKSHWGPGDILPVSMNRETRFHFSGEFEQISLRPDRERLQALCTQWTGQAMDEELQFSLAPFSPSLTKAWSGMLEWLMASAKQINPIAQQSLDDAMLSLLLAGHAHNYSPAMTASDAPPNSRLVRRFREVVDQSFEPHWSVAEVARQLKVSIRSLQAAVQRELDMTPGAYLRDARLLRVRRELERGGLGVTVAQSAYGHGFAHLGRFASQYQERFGERPSDTLRRATRH